MSGDRHTVSIDFDAQGNSGPYRVAGWSTPEPEETWTLGAGSELALPAPGRRATYVLAFSLRPLVADQRLRTQRLGIAVNGVPLADFRIDGRTRRACLVPWSLIDGHSDLRITFTTPDSARPVDLGLNDDGRRLGVALRTLTLYPDIHEEAEGDRHLHGDAPVPVDTASFIAAEQVPLHELMLGFESLGENCEFGLVQRQCQAEPLGLLRFSSTPLPRLLDALDARFDGMGAQASTRVELATNGREFMVNDSRYGFVYHAWVAAGEMSPEAIMRREAKRVPLLVRKLVEDLEAADKIFVFKGMGALPEEEAFPLAASIRRYGPNTLLFVTLADAAHRAGAVQVRAPGFMVGYLDRFAPGENAHDLLLGQWVKLCREAYRLRLATRGVMA
ncbi:MAG: hypothetical protein J0I21_17255 [Alphaproteobacteria bacterium]|nr:hypothetical protein [Alphaproteobacteria bacterium]